MLFINETDPVRVYRKKIRLIQPNHSQIIKTIFG